MKDLNPIDIFNDFKSNKINLTTFIESLLSAIQESNNGNHNILIVDIFLEAYKSFEAKVDEESTQLKASMEATIGKKFISRYKIVPIESFALGLLEIIIGQEIFNDDEFPELHHVHASFRTQDYHVVSLEIVEVYCPKMNFIDFFPNLSFLRISMASLKQISGLEALSELTYLDLAGNELIEIKGIRNLFKLERLDLNLNKITELKFTSSLDNLEELLVSYNPLVRLVGVNRLINLKNLEVEETALHNSELNDESNKEI